MAPHATVGVGTWIQKGLMLGIRGYQRVLSPWFGPVCRFHPSCSCYGYEAVQRHGAARGAMLLVARLLRCHPFHPGGFDPVPEERRPLRLSGRLVSQDAQRDGEP